MRLVLYSLLMLVALMPSAAVATESGTTGFVLWSGPAAADSCTTADCHAILGQAKFVHQPVAEGDCAACHGATGQPHPGPNSMTLLEAEPGLCLQCHANPAAGMEFPHSALELGCTGCHSPHQGGLPKFVLQSGGKLCLMCHAEVKAGKYVHGPVRADNCAQCHGVHGGQNQAMLHLPGKDNCLNCHAGIGQIMENAVSQHEPVAEGVCWDCHTAHASDYQPFLLAYSAPEFYTPYKPDQYALCFTCHESSLVEYDRTSEATRFRNHNQNLHSFHVKRSKGRTCKSCHGVHGADQAKLLRSKVPDFGRWEIPLIWTNNGKGATCYVGCHRPKTYDRNQKFINP